MGEPKPGVTTETEPRPADASETEPRPGDAPETKPSPSEATETEPRPGDAPETEPRHGDAPETKPNERVCSYWMPNANGTRGYRQYKGVYNDGYFEPICFRRNCGEWVPLPRTSSEGRKINAYGRGHKADEVFKPV